MIVFLSYRKNAHQMMTQRQYTLCSASGENGSEATGKHDKNEPNYVLALTWDRM